MKHLILTHGGCMDGVCAAMVVRRALLERGQRDEDIEVVQQDYGAPFDIGRGLGKGVIVTDFALPEDAMLGLAGVAKHFTWLDHHASNAKLAAHWSDKAGVAPFVDAEGAGYRVLFDVSRSGAGIAWDIFNPRRARPWFVDYVEDRDLWRMKLPQSREVSLWTQSQRKDLDVYEECLRADLDQAALLGGAMGLFLDGWIADTLRCARPTRFEGLDCLIVTMTFNSSSDLLNELAKLSPSGVALGWFQRADGLFQTSLRSVADGPDVSVLAKKYGGGGHPHAAAFQGPQLFPWERELTSAQSDATIDGLRAHVDSAPAWQRSSVGNQLLRELFDRVDGRR